VPLRVVTDGDDGGTGVGRPAGAALGLLGPAWLVGPASPVTVLAGNAGGLVVTVPAGGRGEARFVVVNRQGAACLLRPMLTLLTRPGGALWSAVAEVLPRPLLVMPGETVEVALGIAAPAAAPAGSHRGTLLLLGVRDAEVPVTVEVTGGDD
jgi:hypothetical protein